MPDLDIDAVHAVFVALDKCAEENDIPMDTLLVAVAANLGRSTVHVAAELQAEGGEDADPEEVADQGFSLIIGEVMRAFWAGVRAGEAGLSAEDIKLN